MKLNGQTPETNEDFLVFPRPHGDIVIRAKGITSIAERDSLMPDPEPPMMINKAGNKVPNYEDESFKLARTQRNDQRYDWMILKSIQATPGLEWDKVRMGEPETYAFWEVELGEAGFSFWEINRIKALVMNVNSLNEGLMEKARADFLARMAVPA